MTDIVAPVGLRLRKLADTSTGTREARYDPMTGEKYLHNPATGRPEPWPLAGVRIEGDVPDSVTLSTTLVNDGVAGGWITAEGQRPVVRPAGARQDVFHSTHTGSPHLFVHADAIVIHTVDRDVRYRIVHQPDKYAADGDDTTPVTPELYADGATRVDWFYIGQRED